MALPLPNPCVHSVTSPLDWPASVRHLSSQLSRSIPRSVVWNDVRVPGYTEPILSELRDIVSIEGEEGFHPDDNDPDFGYLTQLLNPFLGVIVHARQLQKSNTPITSAIYLFSILGYLLWRETSFRLINGSDFYLPCTEDMCSLLDKQNVILDGQAMFVLSCPIFERTNSSDFAPTPEPMDRAPHKYTDSIDLQRSEDCPSLADGTVTTPGDDDPAMGTGEKLDPCLTFPFDAHLLSQSGMRTSAEVTTLVVADSENIVSLMTSAVYQRYVWSIDEPLIGFELSCSKPSVRVLIGWLVCQDGRQPVVHIAQAALGTEPSLSLGLYDLTDTLSTLTLALFIVGLHGYENRVLEAASRCSFRDLPWRLDRYNYPEEVDNRGFEDRIWRWLKTIPPLGLDSSLLADSSDQSDREQPEDHNDQEPSVQAAEQQSVTHFIFHRTGECISNLMPVQQVVDNENISRMKSIYDSLTSNVIIPEWTSNDLASPATIVQDLFPQRDVLLARHEEFIHKQDGVHDALVLNDNLSIILQDRLELILWPSALVERNERLNAREIDSIWTAFFSAFDPDNKATSPVTDIQYEVNVQFSRNHALDEILKTLPREDGLPPVRTMQDVRKYMIDLCSPGRKRCAYDCLAQREARSILVSALFHAMALQTETLDICSQNDEEMIRSMWNRANTESLGDLCNIVIARPAVIKVPSLTGPTSLPFPENLSFFYDPKDQALGPKSTLPAMVPTYPENGSMVTHSTPNRKQLMLPVLLVDFKSVEDGGWRPIFPRLVSAIDFCAHLGLRDLPIWGVSVIGTGSECEIVCAWRSTTSGRTYIFERFLRMYNIADPFEAMQFAAFLLRVRSNVPELIVNDPDILATYETHEPDYAGHAGDGDGVVILEIGPDPQDRWPKWTRAFQDPMPERYKRKAVAPDDGEDDSKVVNNDDNDNDSDGYIYYKQPNWGWDKK